MKKNKFIIAVCVKLWFLLYSVLGVILGFCCSGYLHAHISYLDDSCQTCLLLLAVDKDLFFKLSECKDKIKEVWFQQFSSICVQDKSKSYERMKA